MKNKLKENFNNQNIKKKSLIKQWTEGYYSICVIIPFVACAFTLIY